MPSFDAADCLRRYRDLVSRQAELFVNPAGLVYGILAGGEVGEAQEAARRSRASDRHEAIAGIVCCTIAETEDMILRGAISDGPTLAAYLRAKLAGLLG